MRLGLKLWSTNDNYIDEAIRLFKQGVYSYIELYSVPNSYKKNVELWNNLRSEYSIPFVIHGAHSMHGFCLSLPEKTETNRVLFEEAVAYYNQLDAEYIILHPGVFGTAEETVLQLKSLIKQTAINSSKILIENKPRITLTSDACIGANPKELAFIKNECGLGFVLDIPHAIKYAIGVNQDWKKVLEEFMFLSPKVLHVSDAFLSHEKDEHLHIGDGEFDFKKIFSTCQADNITIETNKDSNVSLSDFEKDVLLLKEYLSG
jgi:sugar phosphate isomerase/epimerase